MKNFQMDGVSLLVRVDEKMRRKGTMMEIYSCHSCIISYSFEALSIHD